MEEYTTIRGGSANVSKTKHASLSTLLISFMAFTTEAYNTTMRNLDIRICQNEIFTKTITRRLANRKLPSL